jgi:hypothetical protein
MPWYDQVLNNLAQQQQPFGTLAPDMRNQYARQTLGDLGAGMLARSTQNPMQALGGAWQDMRSGAADNAYKGAIMKQMQSADDDRKLKREEAEKRRKGRYAWAQANPDNPMAQIILGGMLDENDEGNALIEALKPQTENFTTENINGNVTVLDAKKNPVKVLGKSGNRQQTVPTNIQSDMIKTKQARKNLDAALDNLEKKVNTTGAVVWPGADKDSLSRQIKNIQLQLKELNNLGVLNGPDLELMQGMLPDPTVDLLNPKTWNNAYDVKNRVAAGVKELKAMIGQIEQGKQQVFDQYQQSGPGVGAPMQAPEGVDPQDWEAMTDEERALWNQ